MQVIISARGLPVSRIYQDALARRLARLEPMLPKSVEAKIVLSKEKHRRTAALTLIAKDHTLRSEEAAGDLAVDNAVDALVSRVALKPMSLAEAVEQLRVSRDECLRFTHARTDSVSVLYRRRNGGLGLIEPQP